jgi:hypothetical protein
MPYIFLICAGLLILAIFNELTLILEKVIPSSSLFILDWLNGTGTVDGSEQQTLNKSQAKSPTFRILTFFLSIFSWELPPF